MQRVMENCTAIANFAAPVASIAITVQFFDLFDAEALPMVKKNLYIDLESYLSRF